MKQGIYFSGNDRVLPWAIAFLRSVRARHPEILFYLIPFNEEAEQLKQLAEEYDFKIFEDPEGFRRLELIGDALELGHSKGVGRYWFRRYAAFWGPLDAFLYLDVRQVILGDLAQFVSAPAAYNLDLVHYDVAVDQVYEPGPLLTGFLKKGLGRGFNSGRWSSRKGVFTLEEFEDFAAKALVSRKQLNPRNTDQSFINYCCDSKELKTGHIAELMGDIVSQGWAGQRGRAYQDEKGVWRWWDFGGLEHKKRLLLLHWAGFSLASWIPQHRMLRRFGVTSRISSLMLLSFQLPLHKLRSTRLINQLYHKLRDNLVNGQLNK